MLALRRAPLLRRRGLDRRRPAPPPFRSPSPSARCFGSQAASARSDERPPLPQSFGHDALLSGKRILIANRGEIAIRVARAARSLGATSLAVCAPEDEGSPHVSFADEAVVLGGGATAIAPYLDVEGLTRAAVDGGADFVHPGELLSRWLRFFSFSFSRALACWLSGAGSASVVVRDATCAVRYST